MKEVELWNCKKKSGMTQKTLERYLRMLRGYGMIKYSGDVPHTGGYFLTEKTRERMAT